MKNTARSLRMGFAVFALFLSAAAFGQARGGDQFTANLVDPQGGSRGVTTRPVVIHIDHYSSEADLQRYAGILNRKGANGLRDALWDQEVGYIRIGGGLGYPIAVARSRPAKGGGRTVRIMLDRPISFSEAAYGGRTRDYPFTFIELTLDKGNGRGAGEFYALAKVRLSGNTVDVESYSPQPLRLLSVRER
ncbi:MAG: hypothetical protein ACJ75H_17785 [Thermoanaerobaculia bacterium]